MKKATTFLVLILVLALVFSFAACKQKTEYPVEINETVIDIAPDKVASLSNVTNAVIKLMGYDDRLVTGEFGSPLKVNVENLILADVSLLFTPTELSQNTKEQLENVGVKIVKLSTPENYEQLKEYYKAVGSCMGGNITGEEEAMNITRDMDESFKNIETFLKGKQSFSYIFLYEENIAANNISFANNILNLCGGKNKVTNENNIDNNKLKTLNPNVLIVNKGLKEKIENNSELKEMDAVKNNKIVEIDVNNFNLMAEGFMNILYDILDTQYPDFLNDSTQKE